MTTSLRFRDRVDAVSGHGRFFAAIDPADWNVQIPACPDWTVEEAIRHVAGGAAAGKALADVSKLGEVSPLDVIQERMTFARQLEASDLPALIASYPASISDRVPNSPAYLHTGLTTVERQVWHMSSDWGIHRHDVEVAIGTAPTLSSERAADLLPWFTDYLAPRAHGSPTALPTIRVIATDADVDYRQGEDEPAVTIEGKARDILLYLWRRPHGPVTVHGDPVAAASYVGLEI